MTQYRSRPFRQGLYNLVNEPSVNAVSAYLAFKGALQIDTEENYGVDIRAVFNEDHGPTRYLMEVEHRSVWKPDTWWFKNVYLGKKPVNIPQRKQRVLDENPHDYLTYWVVNNDMDTALCVDACFWAASKIGRNWIWEKQEYEYFFEVPRDKWREVDLVIPEIVEPEEPVYSIQPKGQLTIFDIAF